MLVSPSKANRALSRGRFFQELTRVSLDHAIKKTQNPWEDKGPTQSAGRNNNQKKIIMESSDTKCNNTHNT